MSVIPLRSDAWWTGLRVQLESRARIVAGGSRSRLSPDDLVHDTVAKLLASYGEEGLRARSQDQLLSLAWRTMKNLAIDAARRRTEVLASGHDGEAPDPVDSRGLADETLAAERRGARVREVLAALSDEERCFLVHVLETDSVPAAQRHCSWPEKSPYYVLRKLLDGLRGELEEHRG